MKQLLEEYGSILNDAIGGAAVLAVGSVFATYLRDYVEAYLTNLMQ